jgi:hypothetical protein
VGGGAGGREQEEGGCQWQVGLVWGMECGVQETYAEGTARKPSSYEHVCMICSVRCPSAPMP